MPRSTWKGPFSECVPYKRKQIWSRRSMILPIHLGKEFLVHNGKSFVSVKVNENMCSRKFGEFAATRKKPSHKLNKKKQLGRRSPGIVERNVPGR